MCKELTDEQQAVLDEDEDFGVTFVCQYCDKEVLGRSRLRRHEANCKSKFWMGEGKLEWEVGRVVG